MKREKIEFLKIALDEISCADADQIESNDFEIVGEDENGASGVYTAQIIDVASNAAERIEELEQALRTISSQAISSGDMKRVAQNTLRGD
jgi:hypothetical protein